MKTALDQLLASIDPATVAEETAARADTGLNTFLIDQGVVIQWDEFKEMMSRFVAHLDSVILSLYTPREMDDGHDWGIAHRMLMTIYGKEGEKAAFEIARIGVEGGIYQILKDVTHHFVTETTQNEIRAKINCFWNELSQDERFCVIQDYLSHYGHLLPSELTEGSAARIKANFPKVLEGHAQLMHKLKRIRQ